MSRGMRRMEAASSSDFDLLHSSARAFRTAPSRSLQHLPHRRPLTPVRSSARRRSPSPRLPVMNREEKRFREHFDSREKERPAGGGGAGGGYRREFWTSEFSTSAHSAPRIMQTERGARRGFSPRSRATFRQMPERQPTTDPRYDSYRRDDMASGYHREAPGRNEAPMRREFDDSYYARDGRFDESEHGFHQRSSFARPAQRYEEGDRGTSTRYRGRPSRRGGYEPRPDVYRTGFNRDRGDWVDVRRPGSPKRREEPGSRIQNVDGRGGKRPRSFDRPNLQTSYKSLVSGELRRNERASDRTRKTSLSHNPQSPPEADTRPTSKTDATTPKDSARSTSITKREFEQELRPEEILVTRKYQNSMESASKVYPDEERRVKIVREPSSEAVVARPGRKLGGKAGEDAQTRKSGRKFEKPDRDAANSDVSSSGDAADDPPTDARRDTDERVLNKSVPRRRPGEAVSLRSKLRDFGDKDDRPDRAKVAEKEVFGFGSSDGVSQRRRSQSREEEGPRERFDRRVNTRDPDDLRNSLARRRKMQNAEPTDK